MIARNYWIQRDYRLSDGQYAFSLSLHYPRPIHYFSQLSQDFTKQEEDKGKTTLCKQQTKKRSRELSVGREIVKTIGERGRKRGNALCKEKEERKGVISNRGEGQATPPEIQKRRHNSCFWKKGVESELDFSGRLVNYLRNALFSDIRTRLVRYIMMLPTLHIFSERY